MWVTIAFKSSNVISELVLVPQSLSKECLRSERKKIERKLTSDHLEVAVMSLAEPANTNIFNPTKTENVCVFLYHYIFISIFFRS